MTEAERREIHELIGRASDGDNTAALALEEKVLMLERAGATDDSSYVVDRLALLGFTELHERITARLLRNSQAHPDDRPPWIG